jgi:hypothetical protein
MNSIPSVSLTDLNRSVAILQAALERQPLAVLTRYHKPAFAVMPLPVAYQLLQMAEQAARLRQQPDVLQLSEMVLTIRQLPLLDDANWLAECLAALAVDVSESP